MHQIQIFERERPTKHLTLECGDSLIMGRSRECDLHFNEPDVSRYHARVDHRFNGLVLVIESRSGAVLNGETVFDEIGLTDGDTFELGGAVKIEVAKCTDGEGRKPSDEAESEAIDTMTIIQAAPKDVPASTPEKNPSAEPAIRNKRLEAHSSVEHSAPVALLEENPSAERSVGIELPKEPVLGGYALGGLPEVKGQPKKMKDRLLPALLPSAVVNRISGGGQIVENTSRNRKRGEALGLPRGEAIKVEGALALYTEDQAVAPLTGIPPGERVIILDKQSATARNPAPDENKEIGGAEMLVVPDEAPEVLDEAPEVLDEAPEVLDEAPDLSKEASDVVEEAPVMDTPVESNATMDLPPIGKSNGASATDWQVTKPSAEDNEEGDEEDDEGVTGFLDVLPDVSPKPVDDAFAPADNAEDTGGLAARSEEFDEDDDEDETGIFAVGENGEDDIDRTGVWDEPMDTLIFQPMAEGDTGGGFVEEDMGQTIIMSAVDLEEEERNVIMRAERKKTMRTMGKLALCFAPVLVLLAFVSRESIGFEQRADWPKESGRHLVAYKDVQPGVQIIYPEIQKVSMENFRDGLGITSVLPGGVELFHVYNKKKHKRLLSMGDDEAFRWWAGMAERNEGVRPDMKLVKERFMTRIDGGNGVPYLQFPHTADGGRVGWMAFFRYADQIHTLRLEVGERNAFRAEELLKTYMCFKVSEAFERGHWVPTGEAFSGDPHSALVDITRDLKYGGTARWSQIQQDLRGMLALALMTGDSVVQREGTSLLLALRGAQEGWYLNARHQMRREKGRDRDARKAEISRLFAGGSDVRGVKLFQ